MHLDIIYIYRRIAKIMYLEKPKRLIVTTRKRTIGPAQKYQLPYHPVLILASVPAAMTAGTFSPDRWTKVARENFWYRVMAQPGTNDQELTPGRFTARD